MFRFFTPFVDGYAARSKGRLASTNPYFPFSEQHTRWLKGYYFRMSEDYGCTT
jgi:hypothetical protein